MSGRGKPPSGGRGAGRGGRTGRDRKQGVDSSFEDGGRGREDAPDATGEAPRPEKMRRKPGWARPAKRGVKVAMAKAEARRRAAAEDAAPPAPAPEAKAAPLPAPIAFQEPATPRGIAALDAMRARIQPGKGAEMAAYHKTGRLCLGVSNPDLDALTRGWRADIEAEAAAAGADPLSARLALARELWACGGFETRIAAAKLLTQARIRGDDAVWALLLDWVPQFDGWAIADAVAKAAERRLTAEPGRVADLAPFAAAPHLWSRRAALVFTLPFAKGRRPGAPEAAAREAALGWAADMAADPEWFIQKAVAWWLRTLSRHDPERVQAFIAAHGDVMKPFARTEALRLLD